jgi:hypothetical protein
MKDKSDKTAIQISVFLRDEFKKHCNKHSYKMSGRVEKLLMYDISGSFNKILQEN